MVKLNAYPDDQQLYSLDRDHFALYDRMNSELWIAVNGFRDVFMASATLLNCSTKETTNYARLCHLFVHVGSCVLREIFDRIYPPENLHIILAHPRNHAKLQTLRKKRVLSTSQWHKLYPPIKSSVSSGNFDTFVLLLLLRNIFGVTLPTSGHDVFPPSTDTTPAADITRIKILRDRVYSHVTSGSVDDPTFSSYWNQIKDTFLDIAGPPYQDAINNVKLEDMDANLEEDYGELLREWLNWMKTVLQANYMKMKLLKRPGRKGTWRILLTFKSKIQEWKVCV
ncbi:E3 ubiquitin-protein ligase DZIP3 [Stylophora pistillata]|uniref:E3 ubiquitin-protein ligase DZIP3 n=1 Tax=Stylophora pistillata TaxID=50429 RepID=A0A2B4RVG4_STYPI|nr:E3 ubiquitin-protein ligase DZIP3 [Stylophora pistillata]